MCFCTPICERKNKKGNEPLESAAHRVTTSLLALVEWWLTHDMPYPPQRLARCYARMIVAPALRRTITDET
jgi:hypothetical protein